MFGHQSTNDNDQGSVHAAPADETQHNSLEPETVAPTNAAVAQSAPPVSHPADTPGYTMTDLPASGAPAPAPAAPVTPVPAPTVPVSTPEPAVPAHPGVATAAHATPAGAPASTDELLELKQSALHELSPLLGHLEQSPEEKFRTTMMMIQASDDQTLLQTAYDAAKSIGDEKIRAQALLDIVNEINYFTQQSDS